MKARFSFTLITFVSVLVSGCGSFGGIGGQYSSGTEGLMAWAQGAGGDTRHERNVRCVPDSYGGMRCYITESASSRNIRYGVPPAQSTPPVVYIEKPAVPNQDTVTKPQ